MTLQIGMIGSDGMVLAGDMWCHRIPLQQFQGQPGVFWDGYYRSKIKISQSGRLAISSAMQMELADRVADLLIAEIEQAGPMLREREIDRIISGVDQRAQFECIAAFLDPHPALYSIQYVEHLTVTPMSEYCTAGDSMNPAIFWPMRYHTSELNTAQLGRLAAHMIAMAAEQNSGAIRGLEIAIANENGFERIPQDECEQMNEEAVRRAIRIGKIVLK